MAISITFPSPSGSPVKPRHRYPSQLCLFICFHAVAFAPIALVRQVVISGNGGSEWSDDPFKDDRVAKL
ncbi:hypothetical protein BD309DRAFT_957808 [Dichomitus squalens]|uniref:Uncharacterized protein n=1 Tax=Dichomitus squalens TaxID=114155 RepID=A0A4Q9NYI6_9APHY|nr:hypothetical protein BD311DRAFT_755065 [Dichomitus squalens]TBU44706.1 hypothetical protein BD309DRAFT_957808 [Dichomitus squalens]